MGNENYVRRFFGQLWRFGWGRLLWVVLVIKYRYCLMFCYCDDLSVCESKDRFRQRLAAQVPGI